MTGSLGSGEVTYTEGKTIIHFGSPLPAPKSPVQHLPEWWGH